MSIKWIERLYFGFLIVLPIVFCSSTIDPTLLPRQIVLTVFLFALVALLIFKKVDLQFDLKNKVFLALTTFVAINLICFSQASVLPESHAMFSRLILLFSFFLITTILLYNNIIRLNQLVLAVIIFGLITLYFPLFDIAKKTLKGEHLLRQIEQIRGYSANKNLLASVLFLTLPFYCLGLLQKKIKYLSAFGILLTVFVLLIIRTRSALIACFIFFALLVCYKIKQRFALKTKYVFGLGIVFLLLSVVSYSLFFKNTINNLQNPSTNNFQRYVSRVLNSSTLENRTQIWKNSVHMWQENPLLGVGPGNWQIEFPKYGLNNFDEYEILNGESTFQRPHNDFLWILCETGIVGFLAYLILLGVIFYQLYSLIKNAPTKADKWKFYYILSALIGYLALSFFDFPYERIEHQVLIMLFFAIVASEYFKTNSHKTKSFRPLVFLLLIPASYSLLVTFYRFNGEQHAAKMYVAKNQRLWDDMIYESRKASCYFYPIDNTTMPLAWYEGIGHFNENRVEESAACFEKAYALTPYNIQVITNLASTYQLVGKPDEAVAFYNYALKISNNFDEAKLNLAALYFNRKEYAKAYSLINEVAVTSKNPKYQAYLIPILNQKINIYLKTSTDKVVVDRLVKNVTTKEALLKLFFDAKKNKTDFETYLAQAQF